MRLKFGILFIMHLLWSDGIHAQISINLKNLKISPSARGYQIVEIKNSPIQLGLISTPEGKNESIILQNSIKNYLDKNFRNDPNGVKIIYNIQDLSIKEKRISENKFSGEIHLLVHFERIGKTDTLQITSAEAGHTYTRTLGMTSEENFEPLIRKSINSTLKYLNGWFGINDKSDEKLAKGVKITFLPDTLQNDADTIYHHTRKLDWDDFKGRKPLFSPANYGAAVFANIGYTAIFTVKDGLITAQIQQKTYVVCGMSWVSELARNDYALAHEQLHFDIAKVINNRFKKRIFELEAESIDDLNSMIQYEYLEFFREMNRMQKDYDNQTQHSLNTAKQAEWAERIQKELEIGQ
jgi:hypothetical protein